MSALQVEGEVAWAALSVADYSAATACFGSLSGGFHAENIDEGRHSRQSHTLVACKPTLCTLLQAMVWR